MSLLSACAACPVAARLLGGWLGLRSLISAFLDCNTIKRVNGCAEANRKKNKTKKTDETSNHMIHVHCTLLLFFFFQYWLVPRFHPLQKQLFPFHRPGQDSFPFSCFPNMIFKTNLKREFLSTPCTKLLPCLPKVFCWFLLTSHETLGGFASSSTFSCQRKAHCGGGGCKF